MPELSMNSIEGEEFSLSLGENGDVPINENPDVDVEENFKKEKPSSHQVLGLNSCGEKDLCEPSLSSEYVDENHENAQVNYFPILIDVWNAMHTDSSWLGLCSTC